MKTIAKLFLLSILFVVFFSTIANAQEEGFFEVLEKNKHFLKPSLLEWAQRSGYKITCWADKICYPQTFEAKVLEIRKKGADGYDKDYWDCAKPVLLFPKWPGISKPVMIKYGDGPSDDPHVALQVGDINNKEPVCYEGAISLQEMLIQPDGIITIQSRTNQWFRKMQLFRLSGDRFVEIQQPFYEVGLESTALNNFDLFSTVELKEKTVSVKKGGKVRVLINQQIPGLAPNGIETVYNYFLVATENGMTGWMKLDCCPCVYPDGNNPYNSLHKIFGLCRSGD